MSEQSSSFKFSSYELIAFIVKWWKHIAIITVLGGLIAAGASLLMKDQYRSTVVFYPTTTNSISKSLLDVQGVSRKDFLEFGAEEEAEHALQILKSEEINDHLIEKFDLYNHYEIDPSKKFARTRLQKKMDKNINFRRTELNSVEIAVLDENPQIAADMANDIAAYLDTVRTRIEKKRAIEGFEVVKKAYTSFLDEITLMEDSLSIIRSKGVNDYESQSEVLNAAYGQALILGKDTRTIKSQLDTLSKYGGAYVSISENLKLMREQLSLLKTKYEQAKVDAEAVLPHKMIVNSAFPADRKTYPVRSMIVIGATAATFCMSVFFLIGLENWRRYKIEKDNRNTSNSSH